MERDYERIERTIDYIVGMSPRQPSLAEAARVAGLSEFHFQRLFSRWAGISPKRFAQYLTIQHAKRMLAESRSLLHATHAAGLSSAGRLHDLFVTVEAVTPAEYRAGGLGIGISYGTFEGPFGETFIAVTQRGICAVYFLRGGRGPSDEEQAVDILRADWPGAHLSRDIAGTRRYADRIFDAELSHRSAPMPLLLKGTNFQINVWRALLRVPLGSVVTYQELAQACGTPRAVRAVGTAVGRNPLSYVIPCHRVIRKSGEFGNYGGGLSRKRAILAWESAQVDTTEDA